MLFDLIPRWLAAVAVILSFICGFCFGKYI